MPLSNRIDIALALTVALSALAAWMLNMGGTALLCLCLAGGGMHLFCHRRCGRLGALIAALVYATSPQLLDARGDTRELLAFALLAILLWRVDALRDRPVGANFLPVCIVGAGMLLAHESAFWLMAIVCAWTGFETLIQHINREASRLYARPGLLALLALLLGMAMAAPFLQFDKLVTTDPKASVELAQGLLAASGASATFVLYLRGFRTRHPNAFLGALFLALAAFALLAWGRDVGVTALCFAYLAGMNGFWLERLSARIQVSVIAVAVALPVIGAIQIAADSALAGASDYVDLPLALDGSAILSGLALIAAIDFSLRIGSPQLPTRLYWTSRQLTRGAILGVVAGAALAVCAWAVM